MAASNNDSTTRRSGWEKDVPLRLFNGVAVFCTLVFVALLIQTYGPNFFSTKDSSFDSLPVSIRAGSEADYTQSGKGTVIAVVSENILNQIIVDIPSTGSPKERAATLQGVLSAPVPTMTPEQRARRTFTPTLLMPVRIPTTDLLNSTPSKTAFFTTTPLPTAFFTPTASKTLFLTPTSSKTAFVIPTAANTPFFTATVVPSPTSTVNHPNPTPTAPAATVFQTPVPTTSIPPTITATIPPVPTNTPVPPQPTDTPQPGNTPKSSNTPRPTNTHRPTKAN